MTTQNLIELKEGLYLPSSTAKGIHQKLSTRILNQKLYKNQLNKLFYVLDDSYCYGIVKLTSCEKLAVNELSETLAEHNVDEDTAKKLWPGKEILFSYQFEIVNLFDTPKEIQPVSFSDDFIKEFEYKNQDEELIKDIKTYDPSKQSNEGLADDFRIVLAWYATKKSGGKLNHSIEEIINLAKIIYKEIEKRVFNPEEMKSLAKELYDTVSGGINLLEKFDSSECPFNPMKPGKIFYNVDDTINYMFEKGNKYAIEKKFNGYRGLIIKKGDKVNIYSDQKKDISRNFKSVMNEAVHLSPKDMILDCEIVHKDGGLSKIEKFITENSEIDDSDITFNVFDVIEFGEDVSNLEWNARKQLLHSLNFTNHIKEVASIIIDNKEQANKSIMLLKNLNDSEGVMIKSYDGKYIKNEESEVWFNFRNDEIIEIKNNVEKRGNKWCVVHGHPDTGGPHDKPIGSIIKCFPTKEEAEAMHKAIIISEIKTGKLEATTTDSTGISTVQGKKWKKEIKKKSDEANNMGNLCEELMELARGEGQGIGGPKQGDGGASICKCTKCEFEQPHEKGISCNEIKCPKCGSPMVGQ